MYLRDMKKIVIRAAWIVVLLAGCAMGAAMYMSLQDYHGYFRNRKGVLGEAHVQEAARDSLFSKSWVSLESDNGFRVECGMLVPASVPAGSRFPAIVLLGGKATGKHAVDFVLGISDVIVIAPDYPYTPRATYTVPQFLADIPAIRQALLDMVPGVMLVMDYLWRRGDVDTTRIVLLGYSFGAPLVPAILENDRRACLAALVFGGGDLRSLIRHNVRRYEGPVASEAAGIVGALLLRPLEPLRSVGRISPAPLLMINGTEDEMIPRENVEELYRKAREPKKLIWLEARHVNPRNVELTARIVQTLRAELLRRGILKSHR